MAEWSNPQDEQPNSLLETMNRAPQSQAFPPPQVDFAEHQARSVGARRKPLLLVLSMLLIGFAGGIGGSIAADEWNISIGSSGGVGSSNTPIVTSEVGASDSAVGDTVIAQVANAMADSVVTISSEVSDEFSSGEATGTGVVLTADGEILTNAHVVEGATTVKVRFAGETEPREAKILASDPGNDLALLKIDATGLKPVNIGDSNAINVGDLTVAFGSPLGLSGTVTSGIVSALNRPVTAGGADDQSFISAIQTDAAINPGNSGGPLVNGQGQVIGVNSAIATLGSGTQSGSIGLGFAIPINQAQRVISEIIETGKSSTPIAGISIDSTFDGTGAKIAEVVADGPAASTDLKVGDIVTKINGEAVEDSTELIVAIRRNNPGDTIVLTVKNTAGNVREVSVVLGSREEG